jgi:cob(I)alamin adenosyltransferase
MTRKREAPVRLDRIYTRGGDAGETSLGDGSRVPKTDALVTAFGAVDELNSVLGVVLTVEDLPERMRGHLEHIQNELFDLGADLSVPFVPEGEATDRPRTRVTGDQVEALEGLCDEFNADLPELRSFVLPGGSEASALLHVARSVCRRTERVALEAHESRGVNPVALAYLNRLSDLLFILARAANAGGHEPLWKPGASS